MTVVYVVHVCRRNMVVMLYLRSFSDGRNPIQFNSINFFPAITHNHKKTPSRIILQYCMTKISGSFLSIAKLAINNLRLIILYDRWGA